MQQRAAACSHLRGEAVGSQGSYPLALSPEPSAADAGLALRLAWWRLSREWCRCLQSVGSGKCCRKEQIWVVAAERCKHAPVDGGRAQTKL